MHTFPYCPELTAAIIHVTMADKQPVTMADSTPAATTDPIPENQQDLETLLADLRDGLPESIKDTKAHDADGSAPYLSMFEKIAEHMLQNDPNIAEKNVTPSVLSDTKMGVKAHFESTKKTLDMRKGAQKLFIGETNSG